MAVTIYAMELCAVCRAPAQGHFEFMARPSWFVPCCALAVCHGQAEKLLTEPIYAEMHRGGTEVAVCIGHVLDVRYHTSATRSAHFVIPKALVALDADYQEPPARKEGYVPGESIKHHIVFRACTFGVAVIEEEVSTPWSKGEVDKNTLTVDITPDGTHWDNLSFVATGFLKGTTHDVTINLAGGVFMDNQRDRENARKLDPDVADFIRCALAYYWQSGAFTERTIESRRPYGFDVGYSFFSYRERTANPHDCPWLSEALLMVSRNLASNPGGLHARSWDTYREDESSMIEHEGALYSVNTLLDTLRENSVMIVYISSLEMPEETTRAVDTERVQRADYTVPIVVITKHDDPSRWIILDGMHRVLHAKMDGMSVVCARRVTRDDLERARQ